MLILLGGVVLLVLVIVLGVQFSDELGVRLIKKGSPRLTVRRGDKVTLELTSSPYTRKLEICTEKKNLLLGYSDFSNCRPLSYAVQPSLTQAEVTIPGDFPLARAVVITRLRQADGTLKPAAPTDEKIALWVAEARKSAATTASLSNNGGVSDSASGDNGGDSEESNNSTSSSQGIKVEIVRLSMDPTDCEVMLWYRPNTVGVRQRIAGETRWRRPTVFFGERPEGTKIVHLFAGSDPPYSETYPLRRGMEYEFQFYKHGSYSDMDNTEVTEIYRRTAANCNQVD